MDIQGENTKLKQFLLGSLAEKESDEIGLQIISDESFEEKMVFAEEELIEDFLEGSLTNDEKQLFYANFINCPERIELLEETALLKKYAQNNFAKPTNEVSEVKKSDNFWQTIKFFFAVNLRPIAAVCLILVIAAVAWRVFIYDTNGNLSQTEKEYAALNEKNLSNAPEFANLTNKSLIPGTLRDTNTATKLISTNLTDSVLFRLALPTENSKETVYNVELSKDGQTVFRQPNIRTYQNPNGQEVKMLLPKTALPKGSYQIKLTNTSNKDSSINYNFAVE